jgi:hypothetical protein
MGKLPLWLRAAAAFGGEAGRHMQSSEVRPGMVLMSPAGCVRVLHVDPKSPTWWHCEVLWTYSDPNPRKKPTAWGAGSLRPKRDSDVAPLERHVDKAQLRGEWPNTLRGRRP